MLILGSLDHLLDAFSVLPQGFILAWLGEDRPRKKNGEQYLLAWFLFHREPTEEKGTDECALVFEIGWEFFMDRTSCNSIRPPKNIPPPNYPMIIQWIMTHSLQTPELSINTYRHFILYLFIECIQLPILLLWFCMAYKVRNKKQ